MLKHVYSWVFICFVVVTSATPNPPVSAAPPEGTETADQIFLLPRQPPVPGLVAKIEGNVITVNRFEKLPAQRGLPFTEGWFLGVARVKPAPDEQPIAIAFRSEVLEIVGPDSCRIRVEPAASDRLAIDTQVGVFRPLASTTNEIKSFPDLVTAEFSEERMEDFDRGRARILFEDRMTQIGVAMAKYEDETGRLLPQYLSDDDGNAMLSWRVLLLPWLGEAEKKLYDRFDISKAWDDPVNLKLLDEMPEVFHDPVYGLQTGRYSHVGLLTGDGTAPVPISFSQVRNGGKPAPREKSAWITDGRSHTILLGPVDARDQIPWTKPEEPRLTPDKDGKMTFPFAMPYEDESRSGEDSARGGVFLMADFTVRSISDVTASHTLIALCTARGKEVVPENGSDRVRSLPPAVPAGAGYLRLTKKDGKPVAMVIRTRD